MKGACIALIARYGTALLLVVLAALGPFLLSQFNLLQLSSFAAMGLATLGLALAWGYVGILSFGHAAFFGLGAYAYAIAAINFGDSTLAIFLAILVPAAFSLLLGHFLFFGRVGDVYLAVITLCVTLILFSFTNSTADPWYRIGAATLGGFNGIDAVPPLNWPGTPDASLLPADMFRLCFLVLALMYYLIGRLLRSDTGRILIAIRENELRSELVGYDVRLYKLFAFVVSAAVAGLGGCLFTANNGYVGPTVFDINQASEFLLWVIAGGLGTLAGPMIASFGFQYLQTFLGTNQVLNTSLVFGAIIIFFVLLVPRGILPSLRDAANVPCVNGPRHQGAISRRAIDRAADMSAAPILETRGLTCRFGGVTAVDNVDLTIAEGELRCLIGPNGAGKSTLFKCMTRQLRATSGDILLRGRSVVGSHPHQIARMGVAIKNQIASVYSGLSVRENIWVAGRRLHRGDELERSVTAILNEIGFDEPSRFNLKVDALSHAHRQWVELGMLLATNPILALLDEPAAGMTRDEMLKTIKLIRRLNEFATIIVVEHDLEFISLLAKRVTVLHRGAILLEDSMENVARSPLVREIYLGKQWQAKQ